MGQHMTPEKWNAIGLQLGRERAVIDLLAGGAVPIDALWMPTGADPAYVDGVRQGYLEVATGALLPLGI